MNRLNRNQIKRIGILGGFAFLLTNSMLATDWKETRSVILTPAGTEKYLLLQPNESVTAKVELKQTAYETRKYLRVVGNVQIPKPFDRRGEEMFRRTEFFIDDNLDSLVRRNDRYSLYFHGENDNYERYAYYRIPKEALRGNKLTVKLPVIRREELSLDANAPGEFGVAIELFYTKPGRAADDIYDKPDSLLYLPVPLGSSGYEEIQQTFTLPDQVSCLLLRVGGTHFSGSCWLEAPRLILSGKETLEIPFVKHAQRPDPVNYWVGINLATRSWPRWRLSINGQTAWEGHKFDRASNIADFYIPLPSNVKPGDQLELSLCQEPHRASFPYQVRSLEIIEEGARNFEVISVPRYVTQGSLFGILVETNQPEQTLRVTAEGMNPREQQVHFQESGLHVIELRAGSPGSAIPLEIESSGRIVRDTVQFVVARQPEQIYISSGDEIYIDKRYEDYDYFFKWYISQRVGNWYQFRPSYQWSGFRVADSTVIRHYVTLLDQLRMPYAWQVEGRTLAGSRINPPLKVLETEMFHGKQAHENDGGYYYWQHFQYQGLHSDMAARTRPYGGIFAKHRPIYTDHGTFIHYDPEAVRDMEDGARRLVNNFRYSKGESTRHTGPSTLFRYLYQAGYDWLGAEQMYGPEETILSALRGASRAYSRPSYGSLHAMQWGSHPFTDPKHSLRLYMSLAVAYMHGSSHMNTEEALWTDEFAHDRYSPSGQAHLFAQHQVLDFIETHSRRGELMSPIAVIQGRNDAWKSFGRGSLWSQKGEKWAFNAACESFDLLKVFYPEHILDGCGPEGWFTSTPYGTIDLLPIEAPQDVMDRYRAMIFLGWNTFDKNDFRRIREFVFKGGILLLSAAHLNAELQPDQPVQFPADDEVIREMLGEDYRALTQKTERKYGLGRIIYFPATCYPAEAELREAYTAAMREIATQTIEQEPEKGWIDNPRHVGFTVWDDSDRRTIYLLDTDWQSDQPQQTAQLNYQGRHFTLPVRRYHTETVHCAHGLAIQPTGNTTDILTIRKGEGEWHVEVQTTGADTILCMNALTGNVTEQKLTHAGIHHLTIPFKN